MTTRATTRQGRLTPDRFGFSLPAGAPLYPSLPWAYPGARFLTVAYETDADAAADALPAGLTFTEPAIARITFATYPQTPVGPYNEALQTVECAWEDLSLGFVAQIVLDSDAALAAGREVLGYPKKLAAVRWQEDGERLTVTVERQGGVVVAVRARLATPIGVDRDAGGGTVNLRLVPPAEAGAPPSVAELVHVPTSLFVREMRPAEAALEFGPAAGDEARSVLPLRRPLGASLATGDLTLPFGRILRRYP